MNTLDLMDLADKTYYEPHFTANNGRDAFRFDVVGSDQVLTPRGTLTEGNVAFSDWANDFEAKLVPVADGGSVHEGFLSSFTSLLPLIPKLDPNKRLFVVGHSKGGALAFLFGRHLKADFVVTFGAPRVGNMLWATGYRVRTVRFENVHDIVPNVPRLRYYHVGIAIRSPETVENSLWDLRKCHSLATGYRPWVPKVSL